VPAPNGEIRTFRPQLLVLAERHRDPVRAGRVTALADDVELGQNVAEPLGNPLQALVDVTKEDLILDDSFFVLFDGAPRVPPAARAHDTKCRTVSRGRPDSRTTSFTFSVNAPG